MHLWASADFCKLVWACTGSFGLVFMLKVVDYLAFDKNFCNYVEFKNMVIRKIVEFEIIKTYNCSRSLPKMCQILVDAI